MALKIHVVKRKIQAGYSAGQEKFYGQVRMKQVIPLATFCERISADASATAGDVELVLNSLVEVITNNLEGGKIVELGDFGNMRLAAGSKGCLEKKQFTGRMMRRPRVVFSPGKLLNRMLDDVKFEWMKETITDEREPCEQAHE